MNFEIPKENDRLSRWIQPIVEPSTGPVNNHQSKEASASEKVSQVNAEFNKVRVNKKMLISYYYYYHFIV